MKIHFLATLTFTLIFNNCSLLFPDNKPQNLSMLALLALGGGSSSPQLDLTPGSKIDLSNNGNSTATLIDTNGDGVSDGIDLTGDGVPNILLLDINGDQKPDAIDFNGDGQPDYFLNPNGKPVLMTGEGGTGQPVVLLLNSNGGIIGFDTDGDGTSNDNSIVSIINDLTPPSASITPATGIYSTSQTINIRCTDNSAPGHLIYTVNSGNPSFPSTGIYIPSSTSNINKSSDGSYTIKAICRDLAGNTSSITESVITIDSNVPNITISSQTSNFISNSGGAIGSSTINWTVNRSGNYTIRQDSTNCSNGTIIEGVTAISANESKNFVRTAVQLGSEGVKNFQICVTTPSSLSGTATFSLTRDDTLPSVTNSPGAGNFGTATSVSLACLDSGVGCDKIVYTSNISTPPSDPVINGATGVITNGTEYNNNPITMTDENVTYIKFRARDNAGNVSNTVSVNYTVDTAVATVTINSSSTYVSNSSNASFNWQSNKAGTYSIRIGGTDCTNGTLLSGANGTNVAGTAIASTPISTTINNGSFSAGVNTIRFCIANLIGNFGSQNSTVTKDSTIPTVAFNSPAEGGPYASGTTFNASCSDTGGSDCDKIAFTTNGSDPIFDGSGSITNGSLYTGSDSLPNGSNITVKIQSRDNAGNVSTIASRVYNVGPPSSPTLNSPTAGLHKLTLTWSSSSGATSYKVYYGTSPGITIASTVGCNVSSPTLTCQITNLNPGTVYYVRVTSSHNGGESVLSNELSGTPTDYPPMHYCAIYNYSGAISVTGLTSPQVQGEYYHGDITAGASSEHPQATAEIGFGPDGTNPIDNPGSWTFVTTSTYSGQVPANTNNAWHKGTFTVPTHGIYKFVYRFGITGQYRKILCGNGSTIDGAYIGGTLILGQVTFNP
jgi:hypothetical protein